MELIRNDYNTLPQQVEENKENITTVSEVSNTAANNAIEALNKAADAITLATTALTNTQNITNEFSEFKTAQKSIDDTQTSNITTNRNSVAQAQENLGYLTTDYNTRTLALYTPVSGSSASIPVCAGCEIVLYRNTPTPETTPFTIYLSNTPTIKYTATAFKILGLGVPDSRDPNTRYTRKVLLTQYIADGTTLSKYIDTYNQGGLTVNIDGDNTNIAYFKK